MTTKSKSEQMTETAYRSVDGRADFVNRRIFLVGEVDEDAVAKFLFCFQMMDAQCGPIEVVVSSCGGETNGGFAIYDVMRLAKNQVVAKVYGEAMSIAALVLQGGDRRLLAPEARLLIHDGHQEMSGTYSHEELRSMAKDFIDGNEAYYRALAERSKLSVGELRGLCRRETYMSADEAVGNGLADEIMRPTKSGR